MAAKNKKDIKDNKDIAPSGKKTPRMMSKHAITPVKKAKKAIITPENKENLEVAPIPEQPKTKKSSAKLDKVPAVSKGANSKRVFSMGTDRYDEIKGFLAERGNEYDITVSGTTEKMHYNGRLYIPFDREAMLGNGYHLCNLVKRDVEHWLDKNGTGMVRRERESYKEQLFNIDAIQKNVGNLGISIDINDCYWQTAFNKEYITQKTYDKGRENPKWKVGRNASIGSLAKAEMVTTYIGKEIARDSFGKLKRRIVYRHENFQYIRHDIIGFVYDMFVELSKLLGNDYYMFLTDCIFTSIEKKAMVEEFFKSYGYTCKSKIFEFTHIDINEKVIQWINVKKPDTPKYYRYSTSQIFMPV